MSNVGEEFCVKKKDRVEVFTMIGVFGLIVSRVQLYVLELKNSEAMTWSTDIILSFVGYTASNFLFYTLTTFVLKLGGAAMFNLSLLTSDTWAVVFRIFLYRQQADWLYYIAFSIVVIGLVIYTTTALAFVMSKDSTVNASEEGSKVGSDNFSYFNSEALRLLTQDESVLFDNGAAANLSILSLYSAFACWNALYSLQVTHPVILFGWV